jgi:hypothetical protein
LPRSARWPPSSLKSCPSLVPQPCAMGTFPGLPAALTAAGGVPARPASLAHAHCGGGSPDGLAYLPPWSTDDLQQATSRAIFSVNHLKRGAMELANCNYCIVSWIHIGS